MVSLLAYGATEYRLYWWHELAYYESADTARAALERFKDDQPMMANLARVVSQFGEGLSSAESILARMSQLLSDGDVIVDETNPEAFEPVMRHLRSTTRDIPHARRFLQTFRLDPNAMASLRSLVRNAGPSIGTSAITVDAVLDMVANWLGSGIVVAGIRRTLRTGTTSGDEARDDVAPSAEAEPAPSASSASKPVEEEEPTFLLHEADHQADALRDASINGVPLVEVCGV